DHALRTDRLLWDERASDAERMLDRLNASDRAMFAARIALIRDKKNAGALVAKVDAKNRNDVGLIYDRMRYRFRQGNMAGVADLLLDAPDVVPYPEKWWRFRERAVREAIDDGNYALAGKLLASHGQTGGSELAEA